MPSKTPHKRNPPDLIGKTVYAYLIRSKGVSGLYGGIVKKVTTAKGKLTYATVAFHDGHKRRVSWKELTLPNQPVGVLWYGKLRRLEDWLS